MFENEGYTDLYSYYPDHISNLKKTFEKKKNLDLCGFWNDLFNFSYSCLKYIPIKFVADALNALESEISLEIMHLSRFFNEDGNQFFWDFLNSTKIISEIKSYPYYSN